MRIAEEKSENCKKCWLTKCKFYFVSFIIILFYVGNKRKISRGENMSPYFGGKNDKTEVCQRRICFVHSLTCAFDIAIL